ncbi:MAG: class I SAM-dependent methyltransferase [Bacteroidales bacterium]|jgi:ubiquinone/menaquinone biosynthesis C-methylase UbiE
MDNKTFYELYDWNNLTQLDLNDKIKKILQTIPDDTNNILDVGCGNGIITNMLAEKFSVVGVDRSKKALSYLKTKTILASSDNIPVENESFDLVFSSELLEHLEDETFYKTIEELKRISRKYIYITVPDNENINKTIVRCPKCDYIYNRSYHLRNFSINDFVKLFPEYTIIKSFSYGRKIRKYNKYIQNIKQKISPIESFIPYYWTKKNERKTMCPNCEFQFEYDYKFNVWAFLCDIFNAFISPKKPYWLFVIFKKITNSK